MVELLVAKPVDWITVLHTPPAELGPFQDEVLAGLPGGVEPGHVHEAVVGPSVGPHLGPGCLGAVVILRR